MIGNRLDKFPRAWNRVHKLFDQCQELVAILIDVTVEIHQLQNKVDPLCGRVGFIYAHDIALAHNRRSAFDKEFCTRVTVSDNGLSDHNALIWLQFNF